MKRYSDYANIDKKIKLEKKFKPRRSKPRWLLYSVLVSMVIIAGTVGFILPIASKLALLEVFFTLAPASNFITETNVLILGVDSVRGTHRSDTIMVAHIAPSQRETKLISIPRDTIVVIPGRGLDKINHAFAYGGVNLSRSTISRFLEIDIPYHVAINIGGLANIIDKLGGITIDVEKRMYYVDYAGDLFINLKPGRQRLNGREAVGYVRFRHDGDGDIGRIARQQKFLKALAEKFTSKSNILKSPALLFSLLSEIQTNLTIKEMLGLALAVRQTYDLGRVEMASIPGKDIIIDGVYYWRPDWKATKGLVNKFLKSEKTKEASLSPIVSATSLY